MRDATFFDKVNAINKQIMALRNQTAFCDMRMQAFERLLNHKCILLRALFNPKILVKEVDRIQLVLMAQFEERIRKAAAEKQEQEKKPSIQVYAPSVPIPHGNGGE